MVNKPVRVYKVDEATRRYRAWAMLHSPLYYRTHIYLQLVAEWDRRFPLDKPAYMIDIGPSRRRIYNGYILKPRDHIASEDD